MVSFGNFVLFLSRPLFLISSSWVGPPLPPRPNRHFRPSCSLQGSPTSPCPLLTQKIHLNSAPIHEVLINYWATWLSSQLERFWANCWINLTEIYSQHNLRLIRVPFSSICVLFCVWGSNKVCRNFNRGDGGSELSIVEAGVLKWQKEIFQSQSKTKTLSLPCCLPAFFPSFFPFKYVYIEGGESIRWMAYQNQGNSEANVSGEIFTHNSLRDKVALPFRFWDFVNMQANI